MRSQIEQLSPLQEAAIWDCRARWHGHGLSTEPADRRRAERGVRLVYKAVGLRPPAVVWRDSPPAAGKEACALGAEGRQEEAARILDRLDLELDRQVHPLIGDEAWRQLNRGFDHQSKPDVYRGVWFALWDRIWEPAWEQLLRDLKPTRDALDPLKACFTGFDTAWLARLDFYRELGAFGDLKIVEGLTLVARSAGWWWALDGVAILADRPELVSRDEEGLPHATDGPAIRYRDGWELWARHGVRRDPPKPSRRSRD